LDLSSFQEKTFSGLFVSRSVCFAVVETSYEAPVLIFQGKNKHGALQKCFWICGDKIKKKNPCNNRA